ncbi:hypothetical protein SGPA1_40171 [Streptomyces misionensis JCM 4497]
MANSGAVTGGHSITLPVSGVHGVPADASAVVLNVMATATEGSGSPSVADRRTGAVEPARGCPGELRGIRHAQVPWEHAARGLPAGTAEQAAEPVRNREAPAAEQPLGVLSRDVGDTRAGCLNR